MAESQVSETFKCEGEGSEWVALGGREFEGQASGTEVSGEAECEYSSMEQEAFGSESVEEEERTFTSFPKLPIELRLKIWKDAMPGPRYIMIISTNYRHYGDRTWSPVSTDYVPNLFFVCREARTEVVKIYKPLKGTARTGAVWIDVQKDVLCAVGARCLKAFGKVLNKIPHEMRVSLRRIAIDDYLLIYRWDTMKDDLLKLPALTELLFVLYFNCREPNIIAGFEVDNTKEAEERLDIITKFRAWKFDEFKDSHPEWQPPSVTAGRFISEFREGGESEDEVEDEAYDDSTDDDAADDDAADDDSADDEDHFSHLPDIPDTGPDDEPPSGSIYYHS